VVQLEPPKDVETYIHRAGRTGRAGRSGICVTFYTDEQSRLLGRIEQVAQIKMKDIQVPDPKDRDPDRERERERERADKERDRDGRHNHHHSSTSVLDKKPEPPKTYNSYSNGGGSYGGTISSYYGVDVKPFNSLNLPPLPNTLANHSSQHHIGCILKAPGEVNTFSFIYNFLRKVLLDKTVE
jgi:superfamily II DNA/RNA helicase